MYILISILCKTLYLKRFVIFAYANKYDIIKQLFQFCNLLHVKLCDLLNKIFL